MAEFPFPYNSAWLLVRSGDPAAVARELGIEDVAPAPWSVGADLLAGETPERVFVGTPVGEWVPVFGAPLFGLFDVGSVHRLEELATRMSAVFGEAQGFATRSANGYTYWILARDGRLLRSYSYLGQMGDILASEGAPTPIELATLTGDPEAWNPEEEHVLAVAAGWGLPPDKIVAASATSALGLTGRLVLVGASVRPAAPPATGVKGFLGRLLGGKKIP